MVNRSPVGVTKLDWATATNGTNDPDGRLPAFTMDGATDLQLSGSMTLDAFGFVLASGSFDLFKGTMTVTDGTTTVTDASLLTIELTNVNVFAGVGGAFDGDDSINVDSAIGFSASGLNLSMVIVQDAVTPANKYTGLELSLADASLVGIDGLTFTVTGTVMVNRSPVGVTKLDWATATNGTNDPDGRLPAFTMDGATDLQLSGSMTLDAFGFVLASGSFDLFKGTMTVTDGTTTVTDASLLTIELTNVNVFAGVGGAFDGDDSINVDSAIGFSASGLNLSMVIVQDAVTPANKYTGLELSLADASLVGIDGLTFTVSGHGDGEPFACWSDEA